MRVVRPVIKGKPRVLLDKEDLREIAKGKRPSAAEEAREAKAAKKPRKY